MNDSLSTPSGNRNAIENFSPFHQRRARQQSRTTSKSDKDRSTAMKKQAPGARFARTLIALAFPFALAACGGGGGGGTTPPVDPPPPVTTEPSVTAVSPANGATGVDSLATFTITVKMPAGEAVDPSQVKLTISCAGEVGDRVLRNPTAAASGEGTVLTFGSAVLPYGGKNCSPKFTLGWSKGTFTPTQAWTVATGAVPVITKMAFDGYPTSLYTADPGNYGPTKVKVSGISAGTLGCKPAYQKTTGLFLAHCNKGEVFAVHPDGKAFPIAVATVTTPRLTGGVATWNDTVVLKGGGAGVGDGESYVTVYKNGVGTKVSLPFGKTDDWTQGLGANNTGIFYAVSRRGKVATVDLTAAAMTATVGYDAAATVGYTNVNSTSGEVELSFLRKADGTDWAAYNGVTKAFKTYALPVTAAAGSEVAGPIAQHDNKVLVAGQGGIHLYSSSTLEKSVLGVSFPQVVRSCADKLFAARSTSFQVVSGDYTSATQIDDFNFGASTFEIVTSIDCTK